MKRALILLAIGAAVALLGAEMNLVKLHVDSFKVIGIEARTSNAREMTADGAIPKLWERMRRENLLSQIQNRADSNILVLYTDYESDKDGPYTYVLGAKVSSVKDVPPGMVARTVPSGAYAMFTAKDASDPQVVVNLWKKIWSLEKPGPLYRAYRTDFEVHHQDGVDVYVGVRR